MEKEELSSSKRVIESLNYFIKNPTASSYEDISLNDLIDQYEIFFLDIYGVFANGTGFLPQAFEAADLMREKGKLLIFVTNCGDAVPERISGYYRKNGLDIPADQISTPGMALKDWVKEKDLLGAPVINLGNEGDCSEYIKRAGALPLSHSEVMNGTSEAKALIIGSIDGFDEDYLYQTLNILENKVPIVVTNTDERIPGGDYGVIEMTGALANAIEKRAGYPIDRLGKPYPPIYQEALKMAQSKLGEVDQKKILVVGDSFEYDVLGAHNMGLDMLFVPFLGLHGQAGETEKLEDIMKEKNVFPTYLLPGLMLA